MSPSANRVSVIVVNFNGRDLLDDCFASLDGQSYDGPIEIVCVDNGSSDGSIEHIRKNWPRVKVVALGRNTGFTTGNNEGVKKATGEFIALLNNDARAHPDWISQGLTALRSGLDVGAVASKILSLDGKTIDYGGGGLSFYGHGFKLGGDEPDDGRFDHPTETLFPSGCAMFMRRDLFQEVGGFDDDYFAFFEDVDLGWRLWVMGYRVLYEPRSVAYHRHHGTVSRFGYERERYLLERNALYTVIKNYEGDHLEKMIAASLWLTVERGFAFYGIDRDKYDLARSTLEWTGEDESVPAIAMAHLLAVSDVGRRLPGLLTKRAEVQSSRRRSDKEIGRLFKQPLLPNESELWFSQLFGVVIDVFGIRDLFGAPTRVLMITADTISSKMAGPAIRAWEMAKHLGRRHQVRMLVHRATDAQPEGFELRTLSKRNLSKDLDWADVVIFQGFVLYMYPEVAKSNKILVADIYDPFHLESIEMLREEEEEKRMAIARSDLGVINEQLSIADYFICASEKQRDFWLGQLAALGRINPHNYDNDPSLKSLVDIVPFGIPSSPPQHTRKVLKGVVPGIESDDKVVLWGGGIYNWFDPLTVIDAIDRIRHTRPDVKLFFMGLAHPNPDVPQMRMAVAAIQRARELGLEGTHVFFNHDWVPYEDRGNYLLEADVGVSSHFIHVETSYSYRTRVLDYLWARLPVIVTRGDALSELVEERGLGLTVEAEDVDGFAEALLRILSDADMVERFQRSIEELAPDLSWSTALDNLDRFCSNPRSAPDKTARFQFDRPLEPVRRSSLLKLPMRVIHYWRRQGFGMVMVHARNYLRRR